MAKVTPLAHGTIFAVPLPDGTFLHGRVMLDILANLKRRLFPVDSPLPFYRDGYLIEMYSAVCPTTDFTPSNVLIPGAFVESKEIRNTWPVVGHVPVDPKKVEFPENLVGFNHSAGHVALTCGEMRVPVPLTEKSVTGKRGVFYFFPWGGPGIEYRGGRHSAFLWPLHCLWELGRHEEVPVDYVLARSLDDLRSSPYRKDVYKYLPFRMEQSYFEKQAQMGLHFERLYE